MSRVRRSRDEWCELVAAWRASGLSIAEFAVQRGLNANTLGWWRSELSRTVRPARLTLVPVAGPPVRLPPLDVALPDGITVRVPHGSDTAWAAALIRQIGGR